MVFIGEPRLFAQAWSVIRAIIPRNLRDSVSFLGQKWEELPGIAGSEDCGGHAHEFLSTLAGERLKQNVHNTRGDSGIEL